MISLTTHVPQQDIVAWAILAPPDQNGRVTVRFASPGQNQIVDLVCSLSDTVNGSSGPIINTSPQAWNDRIVLVGPFGAAGVGVGAANSLTNARNAYRSAGNHNAGLHAMELQALTDGWVSAALTGS